MAQQDPTIIILTPPPRRPAAKEENESIADPYRQARELIDLAEEQGCQVQVR